MVSVGVRVVFFCEDFGDDDRVVIDPINDPPLMTSVSHAQLMTVTAHAGDRTRLRHREPLSSLKPAQREARLETRKAGERRRLAIRHLAARCRRARFNRFDR